MRVTICGARTRMRGWGDERVSYADVADGSRGRDPAFAVRAAVTWGRNGNVVAGTSRVVAPTGAQAGCGLESEGW